MIDDINVNTPQDALQRLEAGNRRFVDNQAISPRRQTEHLLSVSHAQAPFAAFLGCADSRVPIEIIFDQGFGDLFVTRVAGNVASAEIVGSLEFAVLVLGVKIIYILGHTSCGAVRSTIQNDDVPGLISSIIHRIMPAARTANYDMDETIIENARSQAELIAETSPVIKNKIKEGTVAVVAGVYDVSTGIVSRRFDQWKR